MNFISEIYLALAQVPLTQAMVYACFFGLLAGSFANVVIHRLPIMMEREWRTACEQEMEIEGEPLPPYNLSVPRSACPKCDNKIHWYDNIPVLSWIILRGKCRHCKTSIPLTYPLIELISGFVSTLVVYLLWPSPIAIIVPIAIIMAIILLSIDIKHMLLPDSITLTLMWMGLGFSALGFIPISPVVSIFGVILSYLFFWFINKIMFMWKGVDGIGFGDIKYIAAIGAWFGPEKLCYIVLAICVLAIILFGIAELVSKYNLVNKDSEAYKEYQKTVEETKKDLGHFDNDEYKYKRIMPLGPSISIVFMIYLLIYYLY